MLQNITDEQFELINEVYYKHRDEYTLWVKEYGLEHFKEWQKDNKDKGWFNEQFAYYVSKQFMEYRARTIGGI